MLHRRRLFGVLVAVVVVASGSVLLASPVAAQRGDTSAPAAVVTITTPAVAGTYTVTWQTLGGCDPGHGTSGMSGEVVLTVEATGSADDTPAPGERTGDPAEARVIIRPSCIYRWSASFVEATTDANCVVGPAPFAPDANHEIRITLTDPATSCAQGSRIVVRLVPTTPIAIDETDHNAILKARFRATARRANDAPTRCSTKTAFSEVDDKETPGDTTDDTVSIELKVVESTAAGEECRYDVTLGVPSYLSVTHGLRSDNVFEDVDPLATIDFSLGVATKTIYLLQAVVGDSGGANARYALSKSCGDPDPLPPALMPSSAGGIHSIQTVIVVELREGRFNITAALADDPSAEDAFDGVPGRVLDNVGETCEATVSVTHLPERCVAEESSLTVDLTRTPDDTIFEFEITCGDDPATEDAANG